MSRLKQIGLATAAAIAFLGMPITPAFAAGPLLFAPFILGRHVLGAMARLRAGSKPGALGKTR